MDTHATPQDLLRHSLQVFLSKDMAAWAALCAEDVVAEFPFAPEGSPRRIEGRAALHAYLRDYPAVIDVQAIPSLHVQAAADPGVAIAEWRATGRVIATGRAYDMRYATFATFRDGLIVGYREYWNPQAFLAALDGGGF